MDTKFMNYILTLAETGNMTRAAEKLYISQPTLSQFLSKYEKEIGVELFERTKKSYVLTPAGEIYVKYAKKILTQEHLLEKELKYFGKNIRLNLATSSTQDLKMLSSILGDLKKTYPNTVCSMSNGSTYSMERLVSSGKVDMAFVPINTDDREKFHCRILDVKEEEVLLVAPSALPFCQSFTNNSIHILDQETFFNNFRGTSFILHQVGSCINGIENRLFQNLGIEPAVSFTSSLSPSIIDMASNNLGCGFIPCSEVIPGKSVVYFSLVPEISLTHAIIYSKELLLTPPLKHLIFLVQQYVEANWCCLNQPAGFERKER